MSTKTLVLALSIAALSAAPALAQSHNPDGDVRIAPQESAAPADESTDFSFGSGAQDYVVHSHAFTARQVNPHWIHASFQFFGNDTATAGSFGGEVRLPAGARVTRFECHFNDTSAIGNVGAALTRSRIDVTTGAPLGSQTIASVTTTGNAGFQVVSTTLATPETIRYRNGNERNVYWIFVTTPADTASNASFRDCIIEWNRQVAPAPATASFPNDVPTTHPFFRFVEAMASSGLTGGCAAGSFCPDSPVTRGQMAVFLSTALGLHFPN